MRRRPTPRLAARRVFPGRWRSPVVSRGVSSSCSVLLAAGDHELGGAPPAAAILLPAPAQAAGQGVTTPLRIAALQGRGRGLLATRAITAGEVLLQEQAIVAVPVGGAVQQQQPPQLLGQWAAVLDAELAANVRRPRGQSD
jgi:hypothetical protein